MGQTASGILYPESSDHTRLWEHFQAMADSIEDALPNEPPLTQHGRTDGAFAAQASVSVTIPFPIAFAAVPDVLVTLRYTNGVALWAANVTTIGTDAFTVRVFEAGGTTRTGGFTIMWRAREAVA